MKFTLLLLLQLVAGCVHLTHSTSAPLSLGDAAPTNECEREAWIELAPAETQSSEMELVDWVAQPRKAEGVALFDRDDAALDLRDYVPRMEEPSLTQPLHEHVEPVHARTRESAYWLLGSVAAMAAGIGYAATGGSELGGDHIAAMSAGLTLGLAGAIVGLVRLPRKRARMEADLRRTMFVEGEYELAAVARGTRRLRERVREQCAR